MTLRNKVEKKVKWGPTDQPTDKAGCRVACTRLKRRRRKWRRKVVVIKSDDIGDSQVSMTILMMPSPMHRHNDDDQDKNGSAEIIDIDIGWKHAAHNHQLSFAVSLLDFEWDVKNRSWHKKIDKILVLKLRTLLVCISNVPRSSTLGLTVFHLVFLIYRFHLMLVSLSLPSLCF